MYIRRTGNLFQVVDNTLKTVYQGTKREIDIFVELHPSLMTCNIPFQEIDGRRTPVKYCRLIRV